MRTFDLREVQQRRGELFIARHIIRQLVADRYIRLILLDRLIFSAHQVSQIGYKNDHRILVVEHQDGVDELVPHPERLHARIALLQSRRVE